MLRDDLQPNLLDSDQVEMAPTRNGYGEGLKEAGEKDGRVVALCCDLTESTRTHLFAEAFPERFVQVGIAEQNLISVAAGMAAMGKIPFTASYAMFSPGRSWEQVRTTVCYNESNVKIVGAHAGISVGPDGATHQAIEDMAIMRVLPNMTVIAPCDVHEAKKATLALAEMNGPAYIRLGRENTPVVTTVGTEFEIGKAQRFFSRDEAHEKKVGIVVTGSLAYNAIKAAQVLNEKGIGASVLHMATIKPLDTTALEAFAAEHGALVTVEEHQIAGGLGSAVSEHLSSVAPVRIERIGVHDMFGQSGAPKELYEHYKMDIPSIIEAAEKVMG